MALYYDRNDAALDLISALPAEIGPDWIVLGLPRGGVPLAEAIAHHLGAALDVVILRKVGAPGNPELALAVVSGPEPEDLVVNERVRADFGLTEREVHDLSRPMVTEVSRRAKVWRGLRPKLALAGRKVLLVDDGIATGTTLRAAVAAVRAEGAAQIMVAAPVALGDSVERLRDLNVRVVCPHPDEPFAGVGQAYERFDQVSDATVAAALAHAATRDAHSSADP